MLIDTHTHLADVTGVDKIILSGADVRRNEIAFTAAQNNNNIFATLGIHPSDVNEWGDYEEFLSNPKVVGVGEIGLDYHYDDVDKGLQKDIFVRQLEIARRAKLPVVIHSRDAEADTIELLKDMPNSGVMHCFTGSLEFAKQMLDRGFYISASGIITFRNAADIRDTFSKIPLDKILSETDAPWCAPVPFRGKDSNSSMMIETVKCLASIKNIATADMENILWNNAHRIFAKL
jgi:TatD DNase family protein